MLKKCLLSFAAILSAAILMFGCGKERYHLSSLNGMHTWHGTYTEYTYDTATNTQDSTVKVLSDTTFEVKVIKNTEIEVGGIPMNLTMMVDPLLYYSRFGLCDCAEMVIYNYKTKSIMLEYRSLSGTATKYYTP